MRLALVLFALTGLTALALGPAQNQVSSLQWYLFNTEPPSVALSGPASPFRGSARFEVELQPEGRASVVGAWVDGQAVPADGALVVDSAGLSDGPHQLVVQVQDHSRARNTTQESLTFVSDNTPPRPEMAFDPPSPSDGHTAVIRVLLNEPGTLSGVVNGQALHFIERGAERRAIVGFAPGSTASALDLRLEVSDDLGNSATVQEQVPLARARFPHEQLQVPESLERLLGQEARAAEQARLDPIYGAHSGPPRWRGRFALPVEGPTTTEFGTRRTYNDRTADVHHAGTDFAAPLGAPVLAANDAVVAFVEKLDLRGNTLILDHGAGVYSTYAHLEEVLVEQGQMVRKGEKVALVGSTGLSTGPHLHWELWVAGANVDPIEWTEREFP